jgi:hypothetical protein
VGLIFQHVAFPVVLAVIAAAYAAVGQAGAIAAMGIVGFPPDVISLAALALNTLAAAIGTARLARSGHITWRGTYPFIILGLPFSVLGGTTHLPASIYNPVVGVLLIVAAWRMAKSARLAASMDERTPSHPPLLPSIHHRLCCGRDWHWRRHFRCAAGTHFALAKHAASGRVIGNLQFPKFSRCARRLMEHTPDLAVSIAVLACGGRHRRNAWLLAGREASAARRTALYFASTLVRRWRLGASEVTKVKGRLSRFSCRRVSGGNGLAMRVFFSNRPKSNTLKKLSRSYIPIQRYFCAIALERRFLHIQINRYLNATLK